MLGTLVLAGIGSMLMSNPRRRKKARRSKSRRRNPEIPRGYKSRAGNRLGRDLRNGENPIRAVAVAQIVARQNGDHVASEVLSEAMKELQSAKSLAEGEGIARRAAHDLGYNKRFSNPDRRKGGRKGRRRNPETVSLDLTGRHISHNHYRVTNAEAGRLGRAFPATHGKHVLPRHGYERMVIVNGAQGYLSRTPVSGGNKRGWTWAVHFIDPVTLKTNPGRRNPRKGAKTYMARILQSYYPGSGWSDVLEEETSREIKAQLKTYRENDPRTPYRVIHRRVPIEAQKYGAMHSPNPRRRSNRRGRR